MRTFWSNHQSNMKPINKLGLPDLKASTMGTMTFACKSICRRKPPLWNMNQSWQVTEAEWFKSFVWKALGFLRFVLWLFFYLKHGNVYNMHMDSSHENFQKMGISFCLSRDPAYLKNSWASSSLPWPRWLPMLCIWDSIPIGDIGDFPSFVCKTRLSSSQVKHHSFFGPEEDQ